MFAILVDSKPWVASKDYNLLKSLVKEMQPCLSVPVSVTRWRSTMRCKHPNTAKAVASWNMFAYQMREM